MAADLIHDQRSAISSVLSYIFQRYIPDQRYQVGCANLATAFASAGLLPIYDPVVYNSERRCTVARCQLNSNGVLAAHNEHYGVFTRRALTESLLAPDDVTTMRVPPDHGLKEVAKLITIYQAIRHAVTKSVASFHQSARLLDFDELRQTGFVRWIPSFQWVLSSTFDCTPILDIDDENCSDSSAVITYLKSILQPRVQYLVFSRNATNSAGRSYQKSHIYLINLFLHPRQIVRLAGMITGETGINVDVSMYTSNRHTLRFPFCFKNGTKLPTVGRLRPDDLFCRWEAQDTTNYNYSLSSKEITAELLEIRSRCLNDACTDAFRPESCYADDPFCDWDEKSRASSGAVFCLKCAFQCVHHLLIRCYPFLSPKGAELKNHLVFNNLDDALLDSVIRINIPSSSIVVPTALYPTPFDAAAMSFEDAHAISYNTLYDRLLDMFSSYPPFFADVNSALCGFNDFQDRLLITILSTICQCAELDEVYYLDTSSGKIEFISARAKEFVSSRNLTQTFETSCRIEANAKEFAINAKRIKGPLPGAFTFGKPSKGGSIVFKIAYSKLVQTVLSVCGKVKQPKWIPYNHLIQKWPTPHSTNSFVPWMISRVPENYLFPNLDQFYIDFDRWINLSYQHCFYDESSYWKAEHCRELFFFFWEFISLRLRFPGTHFADDGTELRNPELTFIFTGPQGCGKTTFIGHFLQSLFHYVTLVINMSGRFDASANFTNAIFSIFDEANNVTVNMIKQGTAKKMPVERKFRDVQVIENFSTQIYIFNNQKDWLRRDGASLAIHERRPVVIHSGNPVENSEDKSFIGNLWKDEDFMNTLFYCISTGFRGSHSQPLSSLTRELIDRLDISLQDSQDNRSDYFKRWSGAIAPFSYAKEQLLNTYMDPQCKFLTRMISRGVNLSAAQLGMPAWIVNEKRFWDRDGFWCRLLPLDVFSSAYSAFTGSSLQTAVNDWSKSIRSVFFPSGHYPSYTLDEFLCKDFGDLSFGVINAPNTTIFILPAYEICVINFCSRNHWCPWQPAPYHYIEADSASHYMVMDNRPTTTYDQYQRPVRVFANSSGADISSMEKSTWKHLLISRLTAPIEVFYCENQTKRAAGWSLLPSDVMAEYNGLKSGGGIYADTHEAASNLNEIGRRAQSLTQTMTPPLLSASPVIDDVDLFNDCASQELVPNAKRQRVYAFSPSPPDVADREWLRQNQQ